jgi:predicted NBD/HSP70 family sugar kinase
MTRITRSDELRYANRTRVLSCLRALGHQSRKQLAQSTGLSAATVTQVTAQLLAEGIIAESDPTQDEAVGVTPAATSKTANGVTATNGAARRGRPQVVLELAPRAALVATISVNFDRIEATLFDYAGVEVAHSASIDQTTPPHHSSLPDQIGDTLQQVLSNHHIDASQLLYITVACQGKVSKSGGKLLWSPRSPADVVSVGDQLQQRFGVSVEVDNDCNMIASALFSAELPGVASAATPMRRDGRGNFAAVLISYGIGLGLIHEGEILTGSRSSGTELGHMQISLDGPLCRCGKSGCIEAYAADYAIWRRVNGTRTNELAEHTIPASEMQQIFAAAQASDGIERQALREAGAAIGQGLANLFAIFDSFPTHLVGLDTAAAPYVAAAIHERLLDSSDIHPQDIVTVHSGQSELELIRHGAVMQCLNHVDQQVFSIGAPASDIAN